MSCPITAVTFYWRPGCYFCARLERELTRRDVPLRKLNIWDDPASAAVVRSVAGGNGDGADGRGG
jgi:mycoredoxin